MATGTYDFAADTIGAAPTGLTPILQTSNATWTVQDDGSGGKCLRLAKSGTGDSAISIDALGDTAADVEVYAVCRSSSTNGSQNGPAFLMATSTSSSEAASAYVSANLGANDRIQTNRRVSGLLTTWAAHRTYVWTAGEWYKMRLRRSGTHVYMRVWEPGETEPTTWTADSSNGTSSLNSGHAGVFGRDTNGNKEFQFISYGTAGDTAPSEEEGETVTQLAVPTGFTFTSTSGVRELNGSWDVVSGADSYDWQVERSDDGSWVAFGNGNTGTTSFQLGTADAVEWGKTYRGRVRAMPAGGV